MKQTRTPPGGIAMGTGSAAGSGAGLATWSATEIGTVRDWLVKERERLTVTVDELRTNLAAAMGVTADAAGDDLADTGAKAYGREQEMTFLAGARQALYQTEQALARLDGGRYGLCEGCGGEIGKLRLEAFPRATLCKGCKQREERR